MVDKACCICMAGESITHMQQRRHHMGSLCFSDCVFWMCWFFLCCLRFGLFGYFAYWLASGTLSKWCLCGGVSLHKDQLLQDPLTFKQHNFYELFFFSLCFSFFSLLVVHLPHHDHPVTTVLTHYSSMAWYSLFWGESAVKHQSTIWPHAVFSCLVVYTVTLEFFVVAQVKITSLLQK